MLIYVACYDDTDKICMSVVDWDRPPVHTPKVRRSIPGQDQFDYHTYIDVFNRRH